MKLKIFLVFVLLASCTTGSDENASVVDTTIETPSTTEAPADTTSTTEAVISYQFDILNSTVIMDFNYICYKFEPW